MTTISVVSCSLSKYCLLGPVQYCDRLDREEGAFYFAFPWLAWAWLAKPKAIVVIPNFQPLPNDLRKSPRKSAKYRLQLR